MISILDLTEQYRALKGEIDAAVSDVFANGHFILGPNVRELENAIAGYTACTHAVGLNSGTDALYLALRALDIGPGDEVITSPFTFVATTEAIGMTGATPVFADIDLNTFNLDPAAVENAVTPRTAAILPVHLYGRPAPMRRLLEIARPRGLAVIEDCAQAIGARVDGAPVGSLGDAGCFSFFPSKNLGGFGDGGMLTTSSAVLADRVRSLRAHGGRVKYHHEELGINSRLDEIQAAILRVKFPHLETWTENRRAIARRYNELLSGTTVRTPEDPHEDRHVYHQYTIRTDRREDLQRALRASDIQTMIYYPVPLHLQEVHKPLGHRRGSFPNSELAADTVLSLPIYPELPADAQDVVADAVRRATPLAEV